MAVKPIVWEQFARGSSALEVFLLGKVDFESLQGLQSRLMDQIAQRTDTHGMVLVCEHPATISIGREGSFADVLVDREDLMSRQLEVRWLGRGGGTIVHVPGQVAVYPLVPLDRLKMGPADFRGRLEQTLLALASDLEIEATASAGPPGATCRCGQFAFIGAGVRDWVTHGGLYVNVSLPPEALDLVNWGGQKVTSLSAQRQRPVGMASVRESLIRHLAQSLGYIDYNLYTGHPLLHRSVRKVYVYA